MLQPKRQLLRRKQKHWKLSRLRPERKQLLQRNVVVTKVWARPPRRLAPIPRYEPRDPKNKARFCIKSQILDFGAKVMGSIGLGIVGSSL
mmetsp:Transcript_21453/g.45557  ORF Transcript_21453/g.45557 Transcript_21453/m.45557 type:complete len:90 (-) Transcript_21453:178-447(-)